MVITGGAAGFSAPLAGALTGGTMTAGNVYTGLRDDGVEKDTALTAATIMLPISLILQKIPLERIFSKMRVPSVRRAIAKAGFTGFLEGITEFAEEVLEGGIKSITKNGLTVEAAQEALDNAIESTAVIIPSMFVVGGAQIGNIRVEREKARNAKQNAEIIGELANQIKDSKTYKRMPEKVQEYIRAVKGEAGGAVQDAYIPAELFQHAFANEQDAISLAEKMGINEAAYREAIATGADLKVPIESYLVNMANTNEGVALQRDVRFTEDGFSANEADAYMKEYNNLINETVAQISEEAQAAVANDTVSSDIHSSMTESLRAAGYNKTVATANADMFIAMLRTLHSRYGEEMGLDLAMFADLLVPDIVKGTHHKPYKISVNEMHPSITAAIRKSGGINPESVTALGYNIKEFTQDFGFGLLRKGGIGLDELAEMLAADSTISPAPSTANATDHLLSELRKNIHARRDFDPEAYTEAIAEEQAELYQSKNESSLNEYAKAIEAIFNNKPGENRILIGDTPDIYTEYGLKPLQLIMHRSKIKKIIEDHGITEKIFLDLPKKLVNPVAIFTSDSRKDDSIVVVTDMKDKNDDPVVVSILYNAKEERHEVNIITSVYGKEDSKNVFNYWVKDGLLRYPDNNKDKLAFRQWVRKGAKEKAPLYVPIEAPIASGSRSRGTPSPIGALIAPGRGDAKDKSLTENNISQNDNDVNEKDGELYQSERPNDLYVVHNLSADNILHAEKMGGLPVPSIAVAKISAGGFENFGEISLIADKSLVDPEVNPDAKTYDADIYSARYPHINYALSRAETERLHKEFAEAEKAVGRPIDFEAVADRGVVRGLEDDRVVKYAYLQKNGLAPDDPTENFEITKIIDDGHRQDFNDWIDETFAGVVSKEQIFAGFDRDGDRRYLRHNLDNVVRIMKKEKKEGFGYGVGSIRSSVANKFKSVLEIQRNRSNIISDKDFEAVKKEVDDKFLALADKLRSFYKFDSGGFSYLDDVSEALQEYGAKGSRGISEYFTLDKEHLALVDSFMRKLANLPTTYFESKIQRAVNLSEFKYAVVPENTSAKIVSILEKHGLEVVRYKDGERTQAIEQLQDVLFQRPEQPKGSVSMFTVGGDKPLMKLFSGKDESTFIHETGHIYFQFLEQMAAMPEAPQGMRDDMEIVRKFTGNDGTSLTREQHEKLSEALESYLIEGKSPSAGLTRIFQQFAGWVKALYDRVRRQKIKLSPEIRGLFDRMFATDLEIDEVKNFYGKQTDFTADLKDMDAEQAEDYRKKLERANVTERDKNIRRHAKAYKAAMARDINDSAEQTVSRQKVYRTTDAIITSGGVNGAGIEEAFGADIRKALSKKGLIAPEDAVSENTPLLAEIAIQHGYESDTAFVNEVLTAPTKKQAIADRKKSFGQRQKRQLPQDWKKWN